MKTRSFRCAALAALALLPLLTGCIYTRHRTLAVDGVEGTVSGRPLRWSAADGGYAYHERVVTDYQRRSIYPVDFRFLSGEWRPFEWAMRLPTYLLEMPLAWTTQTQFDITVVDRTPRDEAVRVRDLPYYPLPASARYGTNVVRTLAAPMFRPYRRAFAKEIDFERGDEALAAENGDYNPRRLYQRTYERWLADHVPVLAWQDLDGAEHLLIRRQKGIDHYRDLKLAKHYDVTIPPDAVLDTVDGENIYIFAHGWCENRYWLAIPTSRKGTPIVSMFDLTEGKRKDFGRYGDIPEAGELPKELDIRIREKLLARRGLFACDLW